MIISLGIINEPGSERKACHRQENYSFVQGHAVCCARRFSGVALLILILVLTLIIAISGTAMYGQETGGSN